MMDRRHFLRAVSAATAGLSVPWAARPLLAAPGAPEPPSLALVWMYPDGAEEMWGTPVRPLRVPLKQCAANAASATSTWEARQPGTVEGFWFNVELSDGKRTGWRFKEFASSKAVRAADTIDVTYMVTLEDDRAA